jgi:hypothetical protein
MSGGSCAKSLLLENTCRESPLVHTVADEIKRLHATAKKKSSPTSNQASRLQKISYTFLPCARTMAVSDGR